MQLPDKLRPVLYKQPMAQEVHPGTLGFSAVVQAQTLSPQPTLAEIAETRDQLYIARDRIRSFSPQTRTLFHKYVQQRAPDMYAAQIYQAERAGEGWFLWLTTPDTRRDTELLKTLRWHTSNVAELQTDTHLGDVVSQARDLTIEHFKENIADGRISENAKSVIRQAGAVSVQIVDPFDPVVSQGSLAYASNGIATFALAGEFLEPDKSIRHHMIANKIRYAIDHEVGHIWLSTDFDESRHMVLEEVGNVVATTTRAEVRQAPQGMVLAHPTVAYRWLRHAFARAHRGPQNRPGIYQLPEEPLGQAHSGAPAEMQAYSEQLDELWDRPHMLNRMLAQADQALAGENNTPTPIQSTKNNMPTPWYDIAGKAIVTWLNEQSK